MKKLIFWCLLFTCHLMMAQEVKVEQISLNFEDKPILEVLQEIEEQTSYKFFFLDEWLEEYRVSGNFENADLQEVLPQIFRNTLINFYQINEERVILTKNNVIYDEVAQSLSGPGKDEEQTGSPVVNVEPVFKTGTAGVAQQGTIYIGKEVIGNNKRTFTISGTITDTDTGRGLPNVSVLVRERGIGTTTNNAGYYELKLPAGPHLLETSSLETAAYRRQIVVFNDGNLDIQLEENLEMLGEILLEANSNRNVKQTIAGIEQININEIKTIPLVLGERDLLKVALTRPGISTAGEGSAGFNVRGGNTDQNLILLDNAVIYNPAHFFGIFSAINPFTTSSVEIYKGNIPSEYGGRLSSVFDIKSKDASTTEFKGEGSIGPVTGNLTLEIPIIEDKAGLMVGGRGTYSDWILQSLDEPSLENSKANFYDVILKYNHQISEKTVLKTTAYYSKDAFSLTTDSTFNYSNTLFSLDLRHQINDKNDLEIIASNSGYRFNIDFESDFSQDFRSSFDINETEIKAMMNYHHSESHSFKYGVSGKLYGLNPGRIRPLGGSTVSPFTIDREQGLEGALFISDSYEINKDLMLYAGLRYSFFSALGAGTQNIYAEGVPRIPENVVETREYDSGEFMQTYSGPELRLSARYNFNPDFSTKLSYSNTLQYIHALSNNTTISPTDTYKLSDVNIKPQRANQYSLGFYQNLRQNMYEISLEGYYKQSSNMLDYRVGAQLFLNENLEAEILQGQSRAYGAEFMLKKSTGRLNGWLSYTYSRAFLQLDSEFPQERVNRGEFFPTNFDKPHDLSLVANYKLTKRFSLSTNFIYQTGRPVTVPVGKYSQNGAEYVVYSARNQFRIPDYYRLDISLNIEGNHKIEKLAHSFWNISVYNVLGRNNPYSVFFVTDNGEIKAYQSSIFSIPIPTVTYNFKF
ncbi:MAG TPA: carboxypeptidase-like regulatory domain-containing protein [Gillisia sp.]|nr:carboxypeptidase-like regulatory domain-containing protein [Gillisia sp.]